jgi:hypothetical protein
MNCPEVREGLPAYVREGHAGRRLRAHLDDCADCGTELERYEMLLDSLAGLRSAVAEPPPRLLASLVDIPHNAGLRDLVGWRSAAVRAHVRRNRGAYLGGAVAIGAAGAALWRTRARRLAAA